MSEIIENIYLGKINGRISIKINNPNNSVDYKNDDFLFHNPSTSALSIDKQNFKTLVIKYQNEILNIINNDNFEDGTISNSERYFLSEYKPESEKYFKEALMNLYINNISNPHVLTGILMMIGSVSYDKVYPWGQMIPLGLLQNKSLTVRDRAIQTYERWNSKKGIDVLESLKCDNKWLQKYVDKVIFFLKRDGVD